MNSSKRLKILFLVLLIAVIAFVFLDFHLAKSFTTDTRNWARSNSQVPAGYQPGMTTLFIAPAQDDPLSRSLAKIIYQQAQNSGYFSPILLESISEGNQFPILLVAATGDEFFWTPVFAKSNLKIKFSYSNFEGLTSIDLLKGTTLPSDGPQPAIAGNGNSEQIDQSVGLFSISGYRNLVCDLAAKAILDDLEQIVQVSQ